MKYLWIVLVFTISGCNHVPNRLDIFPDRIPNAIDRNVMILVTSKDPKLARKFNKTLSEVMNASRVHTTQSSSESTKITVKLKKSKVQWTAYTEGLNRYYTIVDRVEIKVDFISPGEPNSYLLIEIAFDGEIKGASKTGGGFQEKESLERLLNRTATFITKIYLNVNQSNQTGVAGQWNDIIGDSKINIQKDNSSFVGVLDTLKYGNIGFSKDDVVYKIDQPNPEGESNVNRGVYKVNYLDGSSKWLPANFNVYGCLLVIDPISENAPVGKSFLTRDCTE
jgi:hypothetical protein